MPADKPLLDPNVVDKVIEEFINKNYDYITTFLPSTFPSGTEVEIFSFLTLEKTWKESVLPSEREHVTPYIYNNPEKFKIFNFRNKIDLSKYRWAVDEEEDLFFVHFISAVSSSKLKISKSLPQISKAPILTSLLFFAFM